MLRSVKNIDTSTTQNHPTPTIQAWAAVRRELSARRQAQVARRHLRHELAAYTSQADLDDLNAMLDRYDDSDTAEVRALLNTQQWRAS
jgi:ribosomal 50S subunit-associated protein YjgA (DUF615 family)